MAFHSKLRAAPMRMTEHITSAAISITIAQTQFYGKIDDNMRYHINGSYLKGHLQRRHSWSVAVWHMIDMTAFGRHFKSVSSAHRPAHLKLVHNHLAVPLGKRKYMCAPVKDPNLKNCPCCLIKEETLSHFLHCQSNNMAGSTAILDFIKTMLSNTHPSQLAYAACMEQFFLPSPSNTPVTPTLPDYPPHMQPTLDKAITEQTLVGWQPALQGFLSRQWSLLASMSLADHDKVELSAGRSRTHKALTANALLTRTIWLGWNEALHKSNEAADSVEYSAESAEI